MSLFKLKAGQILDQYRFPDSTVGRAALVAAALMAEEWAHCALDIGALKKMMDEDFVAFDKLMGEWWDKVVDAADGGKLDDP